MALYITDTQGLVPDGSDIEVCYELTNSDGDPLAGIVSIEYKLSDNTQEELIPWTSIGTDASGEINIPGVYNRIVDQFAVDREFAIYVVYSSTKIFTESLIYKIKDIIGVTKTSP